jgi:DedD protein
MDLRAKQRLTGAVILVALFVLLVPELLTGPEDARPAREPADTEGLREYTIAIGDQPATTSTPPPTQPPAVNLPPVAAPSDSGDAGRAVPGEAASPAAAEVTVPAPAVSNAPETTPGTVRAQTPRAEAPPAAAARAEPASATAANPRPERGNFVVQLGSFSSRDNADRLVRDMKARGFSAFVAPITSNGRELFRVRVGPTRDRASAESLATELKRAGQSGSIVPIS